MQKTMEFIKSTPADLRLTERRALPPNSRTAAGTGHYSITGGECAVFVYAAYCKRHAKIGITETPKKRINSMRANCPFDIELLIAIPLHREFAIEAEIAVMKILNDSHSYADWFKCTKNQALYAIHQGVAPYAGLEVPAIRSKDYNKLQPLGRRHM